MKLALIENPNNPTKLFLVEEGKESEMIQLLFPYQFERPLTTIGQDIDPQVVQWLKVVAGKPLGFSTWQEAAQAIDAIPDVIALAESMGHDENAIMAILYPRY